MKLQLTITQLQHLINGTSLVSSTILLGSLPIFLPSMLFWSKSRNHVLMVDISVCMYNRFESGSKQDPYIRIGWCLLKLFDL